MESLKVAVIQAAPILFNLKESLKKTETLLLEAANNKAQFALLPEAFIPCYPRGLGFGTVVGSRSNKGRIQWLEYWNNAINIPGEAFDQLGQIAKKAGIYYAIGIIEKEPERGTLYCSLLYFNPQGGLIGKHRKLKPTASERIIWGEGNGKDLGIIDTPIGRLGGLICWENYMPLARMALYKQNVQIYLAPTADQRESWQASMLHIACEGRCYVLASNQFVTKSMYPSSYQDELVNFEEVMCKGGSVIISPLGEILAGPLYDKEGILYADISLDEIIKAKFDFDVCGHYARPDVFDFNWPQH